MKTTRIILFLLFAVLFTAAPYSYALEQTDAAEKNDQHSFVFSEEMDDVVIREATKVRTRDHIEYLVPNSNIISKTMVNYSLSSPLIRIELPVGVSYNADPRQVEKILLATAENEPLVDRTHRPDVRFVEYADNSINFELLVWIDVRQTPRRRVRSNLYFDIFEELAKAGIEIPFPQRDVHVRSPIDST